MSHSVAVDPSDLFTRVQVHRAVDSVMVSHGTGIAPMCRYARDESTCSERLGITEEEQRWAIWVVRKTRTRTSSSR